ncbi:hypothetical protein [Neisseria sp. Ec49-e6-T10]|uniref:hypothetical protein n=1 Tax=Neisseria sp. Ec49-e6-T10 TaxID=3140744 RepID=UPI003EBC8E69
MKFVKLLLSSLFVVSFMAACTTTGSTSADGTKRSGPKPLVQQVNGFSRAQVEQSILAGGKVKAWSMKKIKPGIIDGTILVNNQRANIRVTYSAEQYSIQYVSGGNVVTGNDKVPTNYGRWQKKLSEAIQNSLAKKARR